MKSIQWMVCVVALMLAAVLSSPVFAETEETDSARTGFWVEEANLQLESISAGSDAVGTFVFHNDTGKEVKILKAKPS